MNIDEIETFVAIAELGGFTSAGRRLHRTQPAISRRLGILEHELGAPMFERIRGNARLTEAGRAFLPHAEAALAALKDGREAVRGLKGGMQGAISLALVGTLADTQHRRCAAQVRAAREERAARTAHRVEHRGDRSRAARRGDAGPALLHHRSRRTGRAGCRQRVDAGGRGTRPPPCRAPRARCPPVAGRALDRLPAIRGERDSSGHVLTRQLIRAGLHAADVTLIDSLTAQKRLAQAGFGLALVPESSVRDELRRGLLVALDVPAMRTAIPIIAIHRRNGYLSPAATTLLALLTGGSVL